MPRLVCLAFLSLWCSAAVADVDLLAKADPHKHAESGTWFKQGDSLVTTGGRAVRFAFPFQPPTEHDCELVVTIPDNKIASVHWAFPVNGQTATANLNVYGREINRGLIALGKKFTWLVKVRKDSVEHFVDGTLVDRSKPEDLIRLKNNREGALSNPANAGLVVHGGTVIFHSVHLRKLTRDPVVVPERISSEQLEALLQETERTLQSESEKLAGVKRRLTNTTKDLKEAKEDRRIQILLILLDDLKQEQVELEASVKQLQADVQTLRTRLPQVKEEEATGALSLARAYLKSGEDEFRTKALTVLRDLAAKYPETKAAQEARELLHDIEAADQSNDSR